MKSLGEDNNNLRARIDTHAQRQDSLLPEAYAEVTSSCDPEHGTQPVLTYRRTHLRGIPFYQ